MGKWKANNITIYLNIIYNDQFYSPLTIYDHILIKVQVDQYSYYSNEFIHH